MSEKSVLNEDLKGQEAPAKAASVRDGELGVIDDAELSSFYGSAVSETYRLKSELVAQHLAEIGMGK